MRGASRRELLSVAAAAALPLTAARQTGARSSSAARPVMVGSENALAGMRETWPSLLEGASALDAALATVQLVEADPDDQTVGLGGLPNENGVVQLDAACMDAATHNSGAVAALENILHPSAVARLVMERTDHALLVGRGAYEFARAHGHAHVELLTDAARRRWLAWKESMSTDDDRLPAPPARSPSGERQGALFPPERERHGTVHCSVLSRSGGLACSTTTSGLAFKMPGRVGDSPIVGAGLYCAAEAGSAGATGRGESAIVSNASFLVVELMRGGAHPKDAGLEVLRRVAQQTERQARWQPALLDEQGRPSFSLKLYAVDPEGRWGGVTFAGTRSFAVADPKEGPRHEPLAALYE